MDWFKGKCRPETVDIHRNISQYMMFARKKPLCTPIHMIQVNTQETIDCPMKISEAFRENPCDPSPSKSNPQLFPAASRMSFAWGPPYPVTPLLSTSVWRAARW